MQLIIAEQPVFVEIAQSGMDEHERLPIDRDLGV